MLVEFSVANFRSIGERQTLSLAKSTKLRITVAIVRVDLPIFLPQQL